MIVDPKKLCRVECLHEGKWIPVVFGQIEVGDVVRLYTLSDSESTVQNVPVESNDRVWLVEDGVRAGLEILQGPFRVTSPPSFTFETEAAPEV